MPLDAFDLSQAIILRSPQDIASWPITLAITRVQEDPRGGFALTFDKPVSDAWKWPSNPAVPSDNFQYTVWAFVKVDAREFPGYRWVGAGFVQMWQGRSMTEGALPAMFTVQGTPPVPGYINWWGDIRHLWGEMSDYVPQPDDVIGLMVSAGNARLVETKTSVRERSNVVTFALPANDVLDARFDATVPDPPPDGPPVSDNTAALLELAGVMHTVLAALSTNEVMQVQRYKDLVARLQQLDARWAALAAFTVPPSYEGEAAFTVFGRAVKAKITLTPK